MLKFAKSRAGGAYCRWELGRFEWQEYRGGHHSVVSVPYCGPVWLQAGGCLRWYVFLRPYMKQASYANGVSFGLKMRFIVKFSHKSLSEWFSCRTFAPQAARRQQGGENPQAASSGNVSASRDVSSVCTRARTCRKWQTRPNNPRNAVFWRSERISCVWR